MVSPPWKGRPPLARLVSSEGDVYPSWRRVGMSPRVDSFVLSGFNFNCFNIVDRLEGRISHTISWHICLILLYLR